jgi:XTP/dITP diphosphohydrolase
VRVINETTLLVATTNKGKLREIQAALDGIAVDGVALHVQLLPDDAGIPAPDETGSTFAENARLKALYYAQATGMLTVAEDSGLEIDALDGAPGVLSARYPGATYDERFTRLFAEMAARGAGVGAPGQRGARFVAALALARPREADAPDAAGSAGEAGAAGDVLFETEGVIEGRIADAPSGAGGFGYDPIFFYAPYGRTLADVSDAEKLRVSHRGAAFRELRAFLERA